MTTQHKQYISVIKLFPNMITISTLCFGLLAVYHSTMMHWEKACFFIIIAAIFDVLDGRFARMFNAQSPIGANLDSLCDFANYTIFPAMIMYNWSMWIDGVFGWSAVMVSGICGAVRLARFNATEGIVTHPIKKRFFSGVPSPAAGILILLPLTTSIAFKFYQLQYPPRYTYEIYIIIVSIAMICTFPTPSLKHFKVPQKYSSIVITLIGFILTSFFIFKWKAVVVFSVLYIISVFLTIIYYEKLIKKHDTRHQHG